MGLPLVIYRNVCNVIQNWKFIKNKTMDSHFYWRHIDRQTDRQTGIGTVNLAVFRQLAVNTSNCRIFKSHYSDVRMGTIASQINSLAIVYSAVYSGADQRKHQSSASLAFVRGIHRGLVNSPHKWPVTRKMFPFDDVIMTFVIFPF